MVVQQLIYCMMIWSILCLSHLGNTHSWPGLARMSRDSMVSSLPSNGWSCQTLEEGLALAAEKAGLSMQTRDYLQAGSIYSICPMTWTQGIHNLIPIYTYIYICRKTYNIYIYTDPLAPKSIACPCPMDWGQVTKMVMDAMEKRNVSWPFQIVPHKVKLYIYII